MSSTLPLSVRRYLLWLREGYEVTDEMRSAFERDYDEAYLAASFEERREMQRARGERVTQELMTFDRELREREEDVVRCGNNPDHVVAILMRGHKQVTAVRHGTDVTVYVPDAVPLELGERHGYTVRLVGEDPPPCDRAFILYCTNFTGACASAEAVYYHKFLLMRRHPSARTVHVDRSEYCKALHGRGLRGTAATNALSAYWSLGAAARHGGVADALSAAVLPRLYHDRCERKKCSPLYSKVAALRRNGQLRKRARDD